MPEVKIISDISNDKDNLRKRIIETELSLDTNSENKIEHEDEIYEYIYDERLLRVLFESRIFKLRNIQKEAIQKGLFFRKSFLVCAPSGSGKTLIGELCAVSNVMQDFGKSIYLVPLKALASEKYSNFRISYKRFGIRVVLSIGDLDVEDSKLQKANIIVTTYEKMDSLLRNFSDKDWISEISTVIIDEIHTIADDDRGPRLESLIVRLNEFLENPQLIGLSATAANPEFFNRWLTSLGNKTTLILSDERPVPLHYRIEVTQNRDSTLKKLVKETLQKKGQVLVFVYKRKGAQDTALNLKNITKQFLGPMEIEACKKIEESLTNIKGGNSELLKCMKNGIAFHHAGLLPKERKIIEDNFRKRLLKVICCTTTLSAGINTPARVVIVKDFKKYITSGYNIKNFKGYYECGDGDGFSYFKPFSSNQMFQMLGRAGRPGLDTEGYGYILTKSIEEKAWVIDHYFKSKEFYESRKLIPKYNDLVSGLNKVNTLKEQVLLRIFEEKNITLEKLRNYFEKTYFWYSLKDKMNEEKIPIDQLLMINRINPKNILKLHSNPNKVRILKEQNYPVKLEQISDTGLVGYVKTKFGVYTCEFDVISGVRCTCGLENCISDNFTNQDFSFEFCDHITVFLMHLIDIDDISFQKYVKDIVPRSVKNQYILNYLFEKGLIIQKEDGIISCSQFGKLIIRLYIYPTSGVLIRRKIENNEIDNYRDLIKVAYDVLKSEGRVRNDLLFQPILEWTDEEPLDKILERHKKIMAGDLYSAKEGLERIIHFISIIAHHLSNDGQDPQDQLVNITEMAETLKTRIHYGVREDLFDLVVRIKNVSRVRARKLYNAGYHTATMVAKERPYLLHQRTGFGIDFCTKIVKDLAESIKKTKKY